MRWTRGAAGQQYALLLPPSCQAGNVI